MPFKILADSVILIHFLWILFLILGALWGVRKMGIRIVHLSGLFFSMLIQIFGWYCPLTHLEVFLRAKHNPDETYTGSYIIHYVEKLVYLEISEGMVLAITLLLCVFNLWVYLRRGDSHNEYGS